MDITTQWRNSYGMKNDDEELDSKTMWKLFLQLSRKIKIITYRTGMYYIFRYDSEGNVEDVPIVKLQPSEAVSVSNIHRYLCYHGLGPNNKKLMDEYVVWRMKRRLLK